MASCVIDTSAVFIDLQNEPGAEEARKWLRDAAISTVNLQEIVAKSTDKGVPPEAIATLIAKLRFEVHAHDADAAIGAGLMRAATRAGGLSLADRSCLALAKALDLPAVTADRAWADVAEVLGVEVVLVR